jgi:hypothetical protein
MRVTVFERDASAIRGEGKYRGPIQIQSNALAALEAVDADIAEAVKAEGCITVRWHACWLAPLPHTHAHAMHARAAVCATHPRLRARTRHARRAPPHGPPPTL